MKEWKYKMSDFNIAGTLTKIKTNSILLKSIDNSVFDNSMQ